MYSRGVSVGGPGVSLGIYLCDIDRRRPLQGCKHPPGCHSSRGIIPGTFGSAELSVCGLRQNHPILIYSLEQHCGPIRREVAHGVLVYPDTISFARSSPLRVITLFFIIVIIIIKGTAWGASQPRTPRVGASLARRDLVRLS